MDMITVSAKTVDEAITKALIELGTTSDKLEYEIVDKGSNGILGIIGFKPAVIRAKKKETMEDKAMTFLSDMFGAMNLGVHMEANKENEDYIRVKLDTENYRERRKETLETLAKNIAYKVKRTRHSVSLEPMNPYERRIIHSALQNDKFVVTRSEGEDPFRHVVISLKKDYSKRERNQEKER